MSKYPKTLDLARREIDSLRAQLNANGINLPTNPSIETPNILRPSKPTLRNVASTTNVVTSAESMAAFVDVVKGWT